MTLKVFGETTVNHVEVEKTDICFYNKMTYFITSIC